MTFPAYPLRELTEEEILRFEKDGVIMIKGLLDKNWLDLVEAGVEEARDNASAAGKFMSRKTEGYQMDVFLWKRIDSLRDLVYYSPFARWAKALMRTEEVRFFYDQMFVKEPGVDAPTPWHQDLSFWPIKGNQICSMWIPLDPVTKESSGLQYVRGSHKWPQRFKAMSPDYNASLLNPEHDDIPDINADPDKYDLADWEMEPGDVLLFHPLTLHGSSGNKTRKQIRRALALRWTGDDVTYSPTPTTMPISFEHNSVVGGPLTGAAFPRILPTPIAEERDARRTPEYVSPAKIAALLVKNVAAVAKMKFSKEKVTIKKQTW